MKLSFHFEIFIILFCVLQELIIFSVIGNEGISIIENLGEMNFPFPLFIKKFFKQLKQQDEPDKDKK